MHVTERPTVSPDGRRLAYRQHPEDLLWLYDRESQVSRVIADGMRTAPAPKWRADSSEVYVRGGVINVETGFSESLPLSERLFFEPALSPDGHRIAVTELPKDGSFNDSPCSEQGENRVQLFDRRTRELRLVLDCTYGYEYSRGYLIFVNWTSDSHVLLRSISVSMSEVVWRRVELLNVDTGELQALTDGLEPGGGYALSPNGEHFLVTGQRLRLYTSEGELIREIEAPPGAEIPEATWAPDGRNFAYIVGPPPLFRAPNQ
jgi:hypothetical protein